MRHDLIVACVETGNYLSRGKEYVSNLRGMVKRHLTHEHTFVCLTDNLKAHAHDDIIVRPIRLGLDGWWAKIALFQRDMFPKWSRIIYIDLDTVIVSNIDALAEHIGIIHLAHWGWQNNTYGSGVMVWDAGDHAMAWDKFDSTVPERYKGDQDWLTVLGGWQALPKPPYLCSAKYHCKSGPPPGAAIVCFHGPQKPHTSNERWVIANWRER